MSERSTRLTQLLDAFKTRGERAAHAFTPDFEMHQASSIIDTRGVFRGPDALLEALRELRGSFQELDFEPERFIDAPGGRLVVFVRVRGRGRGSSVEIENQIAWVLTYRGDRLARMVVHEETSEALEAVGLASAE